MFNVVIVNDDPSVGLWLKNEIEWSKLGFEVVYYGNNGIDALYRINLLKVDLVLSDINMPKMDGIELLSALREYNFPALLVLLCDQEDYSRVKQGMLLGAFDYIQKPLKKENVVKVLEKAHDVLLEKKADESKKLLEKLELNMSFSREKILYDILRGKEPLFNTFDDIIDEYDINLFKRMVQVGIVEIGNFDESSKELIKSGKFDELTNKVRDRISQLVNQSQDLNCVMVDMDIGVISVILQPLMEVKPEYFEEICADFFENALQSIKKEVNVRVTIGVGSLQKSITDISLSYMEAKAALRHKYVMGGNRVIHISQSESSGNKNILYPVEREKLLAEYIVSGDERAVKLANYIFDEISVASQDNLKRIAFAANQLVLSTYQYIDAHHSFINKLYDSSEFTGTDFSNFSSKEEIKDYFVVFITNLLNVVREYKPSVNNSLMKKACEYVLEHIEEEITLSSISSYLNISKNYFCSLFKQETGSNFLEYVTKVKMEWAKKLLKSSEYKTYEVSEMLGYRESSYFSRLFRKYTGVSPAEYRKSC